MLSTEEKTNKKRKKRMAELMEETRANTEYIRNKGYNVVQMWSMNGAG